MFLQILSIIVSWTESSRFTPIPSFHGQLLRGGPSFEPYGGVMLGLAMRLSDSPTFCPVET